MQGADKDVPAGMGNGNDARLVRVSIVVVTATDVPKYPSSPLSMSKLYSCPQEMSSILSSISKARRRSKPRSAGTQRLLPQKKVSRTGAGIPSHVFA